MHYRVLGRTGLRVSEVGFGAWAIGGPAKLGDLEIGWGEVDDAMSLRAIDAAYDAGVTLFDTADAYGAGHSETLLGKALGPKRDRVVIATKVGNRTVDGRWVKDFSPAWIRQGLDASLARLGMEYVDLYQLHSASDTAEYRDEVFEALETLKTQGKIRSYGVSVGPVAHGPWVIRHTRADTIQVVYNMLAREPEDELLSLAQAEGVGIIARVPLASGFLTGKFAADVTFPANDHRARTYPPEKVRQVAGQVARLGFLTEGRRRTLAQAALQYCLSHPAVSTVIPGAKTPEQARANAAASDGVLLTADEVARARVALTDV
jgi:aryl-alcohol dehydrogenase-like predicted oxidoreductase